MLRTSRVPARSLSPALYSGSVSLRKEKASDFDFINVGEGELAFTFTSDVSVDTHQVNA